MRPGEGSGKKTKNNIDKPLRNWLKREKTQNKYNYK
jgi:hypothetical protein